MYEDDKSASLARFRELIPDVGDFNISLFVLELIRELKITSHKRQHELAGGPNHELCLKAMHWLAGEHIVALAGDTIQLTVAGHRSLKHAAIADPQLSDFLAGDSPDPDSTEANRMVLAILKAHFEQRRRHKP